MEDLYISTVFLFIGAILYKITDSPKIIYVGYSCWWAGWAIFASWIITLVFKIEVTRLMGISILVGLMAVYYGGKVIIKYLKSKF
ncbi:hypothetical protein [Cohnella lupini]|uniref:hypothetical protein n=1 Tax=Cohnella lupini TaxID=1294267 RepID=UPI000E263E11|nr:hypothetical protein [Cohnella lupini]